MASGDVMSRTDKVNILLVDDDRENLLALEAILRGLNQNLVTAASGAEALKYLSRNDAALILLDVEMPGMDGFQTAAIIRERERTRHTPIIFLTGTSRSETHVSQAYSIGGVDYLFKPLIPAVLKSKVAAFVEMYKQRRQVQRQSAQLKRQRDFISAVLDTVASIVVVLDGAGKIIRVNRAWEELTGYRFEDVRAHELWDYFENKDAARALLASPAPKMEFEEYLLTASNARRRLSWSCTSLNSADARGKHLVVTGRDVTELHQRTTELESFTYSVSHDMRAPVRAIDGFTRILIEEYAPKLDDEGRRLLRVVGDNANKMSRLIGDILNFSRAGRQEMTMLPIDKVHSQSPDLVRCRNSTS